MIRLTFTATKDMNNNNEDSSSEHEDHGLEANDSMPSVEEVKDDVTMKSVSSRKRGRKKIPAQWSRIIDLDMEPPSLA